MNKFLCVLLVCSLISPVNPSGKIDKPAAEKSAEELLTELCSPEFEGRLSGSRGNVKAGETIAGYFEELGLATYYDTYYHQFEGQVFQPELAEPEVFIIAPDGTVTKLTPGVDYIHQFPDHDVEFQLPLSREPKDCEDGSTILVVEEYGDASKFIERNKERVAVYPGEIADGMEKTIIYRPKPECGFQMALEDDIIQRIMDSGSRLSVKVKASASRGPMNNIIAVRRGSEGKSAVMVTAHFDGLGFYGDVLHPSALDNGSGTAAMMRIAALIQEADPDLKNDVIFVAFNAEETGLDGSKTLAEEISGDYEKISLINIDCVGFKGRDTTLLYAEERSGLPALLLRNALAEQPFAHNIQISKESSAGDQMMFTSYENVAPVKVYCDVVHQGPDDLMHRASDTVDTIDCGVIEDIAAQITDFIVNRGDEPLTSYVVYW